MALARVKTWVAGDVLTAADLNAEFNNLLTNPNTLLFPSTASMNINNQQMLAMRLENLSVDPAVGNPGRIWWNTASSYIGVDTGAIIDTFSPLVFAGQCRLVFVTSSSIRLIPYLGNQIALMTSARTITIATIPSTGIQLSSTTFTNTSSMNYIYASATSGGTPILGAVTSSVGHTASTDAGLEIVTTSQSGLNSIQALVGFVQTSTSAAGFYSTGGVNNMVASWYNPKTFSSQAGFTAARSVVTTGYNELNTEIRVNFPIWSTDTADARVTGSWLSNATGGFTALAFDSSTLPEDVQTFYGNSPSAQLALSANKTGLAEGPHFATLLGAIVSGGVCTVNGAAVPSSATPTTRTILNVAVRV